MHLRIGFPVFSLAAVLMAAIASVPPAAADGAGLTAPLPPPPAIHAGSLAIDVDPTFPSFLPMDGGTLSATLCSGAVPLTVQGSISPRAECNVSVGGPPPRIDLSAEEGRLGDGVIQVAVQPTASSAWEGGLLISTPCGAWSVSLNLDPGVRQPASELLLQPALADPAQGVFAGELRLAVRYRFVNQDKGTRFEVPAVVPLELAGHWSVFPADGVAALAPGTSNLALFAGKGDGETSPLPSCGPSWPGVGCHVCLTGVPQQRPDPGR
jgi:hypothetical protein